MWISREEYTHMVANLNEFATQSKLMDEFVKEVKAALDRERARADAAVDQLLAIKGLSPVSPPMPLATAGDADPFAEDDGEVTKWRQMITKEGLVPTMELAKAEG